MPSDKNRSLNKKETYMVEVWKDKKKDCMIGDINIWYNFDEDDT